MPPYTYYESDNDQGQALDLEVGVPRRRRRKPFYLTGWPRKMLQSLSRQLHHHYKLRPIFIFITSCVVVAGLVVLFLFYEESSGFRRHKELQYQDAGNPYLYASLRNLVMVAGHAIYTSVICDKVEGENSWYLESYQKHPGQAETFVDHISAGVEEAFKDENALLLFSGGETRKDAGPRSEAQSYWNVAESKNWFGKEHVRERALTEEHARDSFENLLFSICRFRELTGAYPNNITVVSYDFKQFRFSNLHRAALNFPLSRFTFIGTPSSASSLEGSSQGELKVQGLFEKDPYGCDQILHNKRVSRDPFSRTVPYPVGCPELRGLFSHCGTDLYAKSLPWG